MVQNVAIKKVKVPQGSQNNLRENLKENQDAISGKLGGKCLKDFTYAANFQLKFQ